MAIEPSFLSNSVWEIIDLRNSAAQGWGGEVSIGTACGREGRVSINAARVCLPVPTGKVRLHLQPNCRVSLSLDDRRVEVSDSSDCQSSDIGSECEIAVGSFMRCAIAWSCRR